MLYNFLLVYIILISVISAMACIIDKLSAINGGWRISERTLLLLCLLGGSVMMFIVMRIIRHKTRHNKFMLGIPLIILLQIAIILAVYLNF